jgi:hypothetical protein
MVRGKDMVVTKQIEYELQIKLIFEVVLLAEF